MMLSDREKKLLSNPIYNQDSIIKEIDISKTYEALDYFTRGPLYFNKPTTYLKEALTHNNFSALHIFLQCKNADKALNELIGDQTTQHQTSKAKYLDYLLSPACGDEGLDVLVQCDNRNNMIRFFVEKLNQKPALNPELLKKCDYVFSSFLAKTDKHYLVSKKVRDLSYQTPLEYVDEETRKILFNSMAKSNPYLYAVLEQDAGSLASVLREVKTQNLYVRQQLQIAGMAAVTYGRWLIPILLDAGMPIYPVNPFYRQSILHRSLQALSENRPDKIKEALTEIIFLCLDKIKTDYSQDVLQESFNGKNLLELAFEVKPKNELLITRLKKAGARLPTSSVLTQKESEEKSNILIETIEENEIDYFSSQLSKMDDAQLIQTAEFCIKNYSSKVHPFLLALLQFKKEVSKHWILGISYLSRKSVLENRAGGTLADLAIECGKFSLLPLLASHHIFPSEKKPISQKEQKIHVKSNIDVFCDFVRQGDMQQVQAILAHDKSLLSQRSSEGLTPHEICAIYDDKFVMLALLVKESKPYKYGAKTDGVFEILDDRTIKLLAGVYDSAQYFDWAAVLDQATKNIYTRNFYGNKDFSALKTLVLSIAKAQLNKDTFEALARKTGFKEKIIEYFKKLSRENTDELDTIFSQDQNRSLQAFFAVPRGILRTRISGGTLKTYKELYGEYLSRQEALKMKTGETPMGESAPITVTSSILLSDAKSKNTNTVASLNPPVSPEYLRKQEGVETNPHWNPFFEQVDATVDHHIYERKDIAQTVDFYEQEGIGETIAHDIYGQEGVSDFRFPAQGTAPSEEDESYFEPGAEGFQLTVQDSKTLSASSSSSVSTLTTSAQDSKTLSASCSSSSAQMISSFDSSRSSIATAPLSFVGGSSKSLSFAASPVNVPQTTQQPLAEVTSSTVSTNLSSKFGNSKNKEIDKPKRQEVSKSRAMLVVT